MVKKNILLADDDPDDCDLYREIIKEINFMGDLIIVNDGRHFIEKIKSDNFIVPSYIFLDINMPKKDGIECLQVVRSMDYYNGVPVIILTTSSGQSNIDKCYANGASRYIVKPSSKKRLAILLQDIFTMHSQTLLHPELNNFLMV